MFYIATNGCNTVIVVSNQIYGINSSTWLKRRLKAIFMTIYIVFVSIFWLNEDYYFAYVIFTLSIILLIFSTYQKFRNKKKVVDFSLNKQEKKISLQVTNLLL